MAYQPIDKPIPKYFNGEKVFGKKRDCKDFKAYFFDRRCCRLSNKCKKEGYGCLFPGTMKPCWSDGSLLNNVLCTGIVLDKWQKIIS